MTDDDLMRLLRKVAPPAHSMQRATRAVWKDGIDIDVPAHWVRDLAAAIEAATIRRCADLCLANAQRSERHSDSETMARLCCVEIRALLPQQDRSETKS